MKRRSPNPPNFSGPKRTYVPAPRFQSAARLEEPPTSTQIAYNNDYMSNLRAFIQPTNVMKKAGYVTQLLTHEDLLQKRRCAGCGKTMSQLGRNKPRINDGAHNLSVPLPISTAVTAPRPKATEPPPLLCKHHPGQVINRHWSCCNQHVSAYSAACGGSPRHILRTYDPLELERLYQFHPTPESSSSDIRLAVAFDCEMGTAVSGDSEIIRITIIDYFTSDILLNRFVDPGVPMADLNTRYSGVTWADIRNAKKQGMCLMGTAEARSATWQFVGPQTIVVGHGASNDLRTLRWLHAAVVDSCVIEGARLRRKQQEEEAAKAALMEDGLVYDSARLNKQGEEKAALPSVPAEVKKKKKPKGTGDLALKTLTKKYMGRDIQMGGKLGHDSLEDAIAARDVVHWQIFHPE